MKSIKAEGARFIVAGTINTVTTYLIYLATLSLGYRVAFTIAFVAGVLIAYCLNSLFVFKRPLSWRGLLQYPVVYLTQYVLGLLLLAFLIEALGMDKVLAPLVNLAILTPLTFFMNRWFMLRRVGK